MALLGCFHFSTKPFPTQLSGDRKDSPAESFPPLAAVFQRRLLAGIGSASLVAVGANFAGVTSFLLGLSPETGRKLKLDVLYSVGGYNRCFEANEGFEFIYPANWVRDQRLYYREAKKGEVERSLDPPALNGGKIRSKVNEPVIGFGPPGGDGELNVSVIVSPLPLDFSIEAFGGPKEVGEAVVKAITGSGRRPDISAFLIDATMTEDPFMKVKYYKLEFRVESPSFRRHNVAICTARGGHLFTMNAQAPESAWPDIREEFYTMADSFHLLAT